MNKKISALLERWRGIDLAARQASVDDGGAQYDAGFADGVQRCAEYLKEAFTELDDALLAQEQELTVADLNAAATACEAQGNIQNLRQSEQQGLATIDCTWGNGWKALATKFAGLALPPAHGWQPQEQQTKRKI